MKTVEELAYNRLVESLPKNLIEQVELALGRSVAVHYVKIKEALQWLESDRQWLLESGAYESSIIKRDAFNAVKDHVERMIAFVYKGEAQELERKYQKGE